MQYSPKLKEASREIKAILDKYDIAGVILLHSPGFAEYIYSITPSYSIAKMEGNQLRIKTNPNDSKEIKIRKVTDTLNMFSLLATVGRPIIENTIEAEELIKQHVEVIKTDPGTHTSHEQQNN